MPISKQLGITATATHAATYFLCICLFSISFLVFLNSAISFVITDRIGQKHDVGDAVGTLGFADELLALVTCPIWGWLSDKIGVRAVAVAGYTIVGLALAFVTLAKDVYPQLLLVRIFFALGGSATATMVTAILPAMTSDGSEGDSFRRAALATNPQSASPADIHAAPDLHQGGLVVTETDSQKASSRLAGFVGVFTGLGALVALLVFLPLPAFFQTRGVSAAVAIAYSFYIVAAVALLVAIVCFFGLRDLPGETGKSMRKLFRNGNKDNDLPIEASDSGKYYPTLLSKAVILGFRDVDVGLAYVGGWVARASSVAISLFIPLFVNAYFISSGRCYATPGQPKDPSEIKRNCKEAYLVAAKLAGISQMVALLFAPIFGYLSAHYRLSNAPLLLAAVAGLAGNIAFGRLQIPDPAAPGGGAGIYLLVMLIGIGQIGAIVCSLGLLARGIHTKEVYEPLPSSTEATEAESQPLMSPLVAPKPTTRAHLKGSIAGVYSLGGGAGILFLTKVGGIMFDKVDRGSPFYIMAAFNAVLLVTGVGVAVLNRQHSRLT